MTQALHNRGKGPPLPTEQAGLRDQSRCGSFGGKSHVHVRNRTTIHLFAVRTHVTKWLCVTSFFSFSISFHVKLHVCRGCRTEPVGEVKERLMPVCNKESPHINKINNSSVVCFYKYCFSLRKNFSSIILLAAVTVRYSTTSLIFTSRVSNSYFKRGT